MKESMKKIVVGFLFTLLLGATACNVSAVNSDHVKIGVSGAATVACALGAWYCFDNAAKLALEPDDSFGPVSADITKKQKLYKVLGYVLAAGSLGSGVYCGCNIYNVWKKSKTENKPNVPKKPTPDGSQQPGDNPKQPNPTTSVAPEVIAPPVDVIKQGFEKLRKPDTPDYQDYQYSFMAYEQYVLPIVERHCSNVAAFQNGDVDAVINCYNECFNEISGRNFNHVARGSASEKKQFTQERREAVGGMLRDHINNILSQQWGGGSYTPIYEKLSDLGESSGEDEVEKRNMFNKFYRGVLHLEDDRRVEVARQRDLALQREEARKQRIAEEKAVQEARERQEALQKEREKYEGFDNKIIAVAHENNRNKQNALFRDDERRGDMMLIRHVAGILRLHKDKNKEEIYTNDIVQNIRNAAGVENCSEERAKRLLQAFFGN